MTQRRVLLPVRRYLQQNLECAVAAAASIANYYDSAVDYVDVRELLPLRMRRYGLYSSQEAKLLNMLGFDSVKIVTSDLDIIDYSWAHLSKRGLLKKLRKLSVYTKRTGNLELSRIVDDLVDWLGDPAYNNKLIIDCEFAKYIRRSLDHGHPVGVSVNATSMYRLQKGPWKKDSDIKGRYEEHALVIRGYDMKGVFLVDSDHSFYSLALRRYAKGYYKVPWEKLLVNIPFGDLILVD